MRKIIIAIDGPAGAGKSTISKIIAKKLKLEYIDTGAMYRAVTLKALNNNIDLDNEKELLNLLSETTIYFEGGRIILDGCDISEEIRMPSISERVSEIAAKFVVREKLVILQREMASNKNVVMDGRDIGTYVLTNANFKIYLTASVKERAERRYEELVSKGIKVLYEDVYSDIEERDKKDTNRELNPLRRAEDAVLVDTSGKNINEVVEEILNIINDIDSCI
jgi:cytidylate kinase